jgi:hypothetical protein
VRVVDLIVDDIVVNCVSRSNMVSASRLALKLL